MPLIKEYDLLFVHIPKTGGSSIEHTFGVYGMPNPDVFWGLEEENINGVKMAPQHFTPKVLKERLGKEYNNYFKFTFTRNPYNKMLSEFGWLKRSTDMGEFNKWLPEHLKNIDSDHKLPQSEYVDDTIDFVGKLENYQQDFNSMLLKAGWEGKITLPVTHQTAGNKDEMFKSISPKNINLINEVYRDDFVNFDYIMF